MIRRWIDLMLTAGLLMLSLLFVGAAWAQSDDGSASGATTAGGEAASGSAADVSSRPAGPDGQETSGAAAASGAQPGGQAGQGQAGMSAAEAAAARAAIWERLMVTLEALPDRWSSLPPPCVKPSGRSAEEVVSAASESEQSAAVELTASIMQTPPAEREQRMAVLRQQRPWTEVDLWIAGYAIEALQTKDFDVTGRIAEAWLSLLAHCGRRDVLLFAAGMGFYLSSLRLLPERRLAATERWLSLPLPPQSTRGSASLHGQYARTAFSLGKNQAALAAHQKARSLYKDVGSKVGQGNSWFGEADVQFRLGANEAALNAYRNARSLYIDVGDKQGQGHSWFGEADVQFLLGANEAALNAYRNARSLYIDVGDKQGQGNSWKGEGDVHLGLGANEAALNAYRNARFLFIDVGSKQGQGNSWKGEGDVHLGLGANEAALNAYRNARSLYKDVGSKVGQGNSWFGEADVQFRLGANEAALNAYRNARSLYKDVGSKVGQGNSWFGEADVQFRLGANEAALNAADKAIAFAEHNAVPFNEFIARMRKAEILLAAGTDADVIAEAERARAVLRRVRQQNLTDKARTSVADTALPYDLLVTRLLRRSDDRTRSVERALVLAEEAHAPILLDILRTEVRSSGSKTRSEDVVRLERRREQLEREIARAGVTAPLRDELAAVDAQLENQRMVDVSRQNSSLANATILTRAARKRLVRAVGPVLLYYVAPEETVLFLLRPGRAPVVRRIPLSWPELQRQVNQLRYDLANPHYHRRACAALQKLYAKLIDRVATQLGDTDRLTIIPHGPLHELPFASLLLGTTSDPSASATGRQASQPSQQQQQQQQQCSRKNPLNHLPTLGDRWHVTIAPSLSALHTVRERKHKRDRKARRRRARGAKPDDRIPFLGIASGENLNTAPEVRQAGTLFGPASKLSLRTDGSRDTYRNYAGRAAHILLSTHGTHVAQSRFGYLDLTAKEGHAVRLTASEIATRPLVAELVTLAACETARGIAMLSDERLDLSRAFLIAGADAILATRWRVPDGDDTRQFVVDFYTALLRGGPNGTRMRKDEALTRARQLSRQRGDTAKLWAAWVLSGDGR